MVIAVRLERLRALVEVEPKDVAAVVFPAQSAENAVRSWYKRANQRRDAFKLGEIEAAVDYLVAEGRRKGILPADIRILPGFPFVDYGDAMRLERGV